MFPVPPSDHFRFPAPSPQPDWLNHLRRGRPAVQLPFSLPARRPHLLDLLLPRLQARAKAQEDLRAEEFMAPS
jgi:hypothetical protein